MSYLIFYKTNDVFEAEEKLNSHKIECTIVPTPVQDKAYCGVCISVNLDLSPETLDVIAPLEHIVIGEGES